LDQRHGRSEFVRFRRNAGRTAVYRVLPMDIACFREWGRIMDKKPPELLQDAMIAATARVHRLIVATRNERDFKQLDVRTFNPFKS
jgi:predicted nucleic acid-binding protein